MTEDERIDLTDQLGLSGQDVVIVEGDDNTPAVFNVLLIEGKRIFHVATGWGELVVTSLHLNDQGEAEVVDGVTILDVGGQLTPIGSE